MDEADLNRNPYAIDFVNRDLSPGPAYFEENVIAAQRLQFFRWIKLTLGCPFKALFEMSAVNLIQVWIPAAVCRSLAGRHKSFYS